MDILVSLVIHSALLGSAWAGYIEGIPGARNMLNFFVLAVLLPMALIMQTDGAQAAAAKQLDSPTPLPWLFRLSSLFVLSVLVWQGAILTGLAYGVAWVLTLAANKAVRDLRAAKGPQ